MTVFEIVTPSQSINEFIPRIEGYFRFGVKSAWLVHPPVKQVVIFRPDMELQVYNEGEVVDRALGFKIALSEIFS